VWFVPDKALLQTIVPSVRNAMIAVAAGPEIRKKNWLDWAAT